MNGLRLHAPWLDLDLGTRMPVLSFAPHRPGFVRARRILWREVRDADLPQDFDAYAALAQWLADRGASDAVCFLTSRALAAHETAETEIEGIRARAIATVGLSNAERIGHRRAAPSGLGTINLAVQLSVPLAPAALIEALTLAAEARTLAVLDAGLVLADGLATGTGTDCIAVAAPHGSERHAGKHTAVGEALGRVATRAIRSGVERWMAETGGAPR